MPPRPDPGWAFIEPASTAQPEDEDRRQLALTFAKVFSGGQGEAVLAHLRALTTERCLGPDCTDQALRALEGQRALVFHILSLVARGQRGA